MTGYRDTGAWKTSVDVPDDADFMQGSYFCNSCRKLLADYKEEWFVLVELYAAGAPQVYPVTDGAVYRMRCYDITVSYDQQNYKYRIAVAGNYDPAGNS